MTPTRFRPANPGEEGSRPPAVAVGALADVRGLVLGEHAARRLRERPELLADARKRVAAWLDAPVRGSHPDLLEWSAVLDAGVDAVIAVLTGVTERDVRLRRCSPCTGDAFVSAEERAAVLKRLRPARTLAALR